MVTDKVSVQLHVCVCAVFEVFVFAFFPQGSTRCEDGGRLGRPGPEVSSIRAGSDPGGQLRPRGAHAHPGRVQGSAAVLRQPVGLQDALMLDSGLKCSKKWTYLGYLHTHTHTHP